MLPLCRKGIPKLIGWIVEKILLTRVGSLVKQNAVGYTTVAVRIHHSIFLDGIYR